MRRFWLLVLGCFATCLLSAQTFNENDFIAPLDIPLYLSGNFAEMRSNHFHSGLDFKTQGREGLNVVAAAEGFVSRIKVSPYGYGQALYVDHPNGYTTVYAHLSSYNDSITNFLRNAQYDLKSWELDLEVAPGQLPVAQGELIGLSGNTGSSGGPHLHFEIRETETEFPINPLLWNFKVKDNIAPLIRGILAIQKNGTRSCDQLEKPKVHAVVRSRNNYTLAKDLTVAPGEYGFAIHALDQLNDQPNKCGIYEIQMFVDSVLVFEQRMDKLDFSTKSHMNAHTVFEIYKTEKRSIHRSFTLPNNRLPIYKVLENQGMVAIEAGETKSIHYNVKDVHGNQSVVDFNISASKDVPDGTVVTDHVFAFDKVNAFRTEQCSVFIPEGRLFDDFNFNYAQLDTIEGCITPTHEVGCDIVPLSNSYLLKIKTDNLDSALMEKAIVMRYDRSRNRFYNEGGLYKRGWMEARPKKFGAFVVKLDTVPPVLKRNVLRSDMKGKKSFSMIVNDDLSGVDRYEAWINGQWILLEYEPKRSKLRYQFDENRLDHGTQSLVVRVWDERKNLSEFTYDFVW